MIDTSPRNNFDSPPGCCYFPPSRCCVPENGTTNVLLKQQDVCRSDGPMEALLANAMQTGAMDAVTAPARGPTMGGGDTVGIQMQQNGVVDGPRETS
jgi:hypothetical protein